jgi:hypothetical protein
MNQTLDQQNIIHDPLKATQQEQPKLTRAMIPLDTVLYNEIKTLLAGLSQELGMKVNMPMFLRKTIVENWKVQMERYRRLNPSAKKTR